jgi:hypothetical protein
MDAHLSAIGTAAREWLQGCATALASRKPPPQSESLEAALDAFAAEFATLRREGLIRPLSGAEAEHLFALSFALEELRQNFRDLARCIDDWAEAFAR